MEAEYDQIAEEYDATREAPTAREVDAIVGALDDAKTVLDVGVGTGRFAIPISERGFEVVGVDVSRRMLLRARHKGVREVMLGDAYCMPIRDKTFDAAVIIHVIHVVADWRSAMREVGRVTKGKVLSILRVPLVPPASPSPSPVASNPSGGDPLAGQRLGAGGYPVRTQHRMWQNEQELKERAPPEKLVRIRDELVEISIADAFKRIEAKRPFSAQLVPPEAKQMMMERIMAMNRGQVVHRRIVEDLAVWDASQLANL